MLPFIKKRVTKKEEERSSSSFLVNGGLLTEKLITCFNGRYKNPIRTFTAEELIKATNGFAVRIDSRHHERLFMGSIEQRPVLVRDFGNNDSRHALNMCINDIAVSSQMSHHKNVLKLLGCCLEFKAPTLVYEYTRTMHLSELLHNWEVGINNNVEDRSLSWKNRLRIAKDIAGVLLYLHTAFPTPIIYRDLNPSNVIVDDYGVAKLFDFSLSIFLPPGKSEVKDIVMATWGYIDIEYCRRGILTEKTDVYNLGMLLVTLLTGEKKPWQLQRRDKDERIPHDTNSEDNYDYVDLINDYVNDHFNKIKNHIITGDGERFEQQLQDFIALALKCIVRKREDRPEMMDVAKELTRIEKSCIHPC